jgi:hypothetical protein
MARYVRPVYSVADVFAAACAAYRINGEYLKNDDVTYYDDGHEYSHKVNRLANKTLVHKFLKGELGMSLEDHEQGDKVMQYCRGLTFKLLTDKRLSDFEQTMLAIVEKSTTDSNYDIAVVASLPASYERSIARAEQNVRLREAAGCINAEVGSKVELDIEVVRCNYSNEWGVFYVTAITDGGVVFFARNSAVDLGSKLHIKGKVKRHKEDRTQLSHVKVI